MFAEIRPRGNREYAFRQTDVPVWRVKMRRLLKALTLMMGLCLVLPLTMTSACADTRLVFHSQGFLTQRQQVYYHFFQFANPTATVALLGPMWQREAERSVIRGLIWFKADDDGDVWTGLGFWPSLDLTDRLGFSLDSRYLFGWRDTRNQLQVIPWLQYALDERNALRLQASRTEDIGDGVSQPWFLGPFWIRDLGRGREFRLGYQGELGGSESQLVIGYNFNL
jgi:hypothetical protein